MGEPIVSMKSKLCSLFGHALIALATAAPALAADLPPEALSTKPDGRYYTGYFATWLDPYFDATGKTPAEVWAVSRLARVPAAYTHAVISFATPNFSWGGLAANSWVGTGIEFQSTPASVKAAINVLHMRKLKVILAVGGATYYDWDGLAAEGQAGSGPRIDALAKIMTDLGIDGLDVDYELDANVTRYANVTRAMRKAVDKAGGGRLLTVAGWSTGADCTAQTTDMPDCAGKLSYWGGNAGRERLLVRDHPDVAKMFDVVNVMSYDARYEHYDGVMAYKQYRKLFGKNTVVSIGFEPAPEGWAGGILVVNNADAQCTGSRILQDQYGKNLDSPYSVARFNMAVKKSKSPNKNPHDGAMIWSILKTASGSCGSAQIASPGTVGKKSATMLGLVNDPLLNDAPWK
jgi:hypothetical protein